MKYIFLIFVLVGVFLAVWLAAFTSFTLDNNHYDRLKWLTMKWHYITTFVALLVKLFGFPYGSETVLLVAGIGALMAGLLGVSSMNYYKTGDEEADFDDDDDDEECDSINDSNEEEGDE
jgi:hypothetical protein